MKSEMLEQMFYFQGSKDRQLLGFLHSPDRDCEDIGIIYCHPFAEEKNCSHAIVVKAARVFAQEGFPVLRFDFSGCGDSEGDLEDVTIDDWLVDIKNAVTQIKSHTNVKNIGLWGLRFGGGLALLFAAKHQFIRFSILWNPVIDFKGYIHQFLRQAFGKTLVRAGEKRITVKSLISKLQQQKSVEAIGYSISSRLYDSFAKIANSPSHVKLCCPLFINFISLMEGTPLPLAKFVENLQKRATPVESLNIEVEPFWDRQWCWDSDQIIRETTNWLRAWK